MATLEQIDAKLDQVAVVVTELKVVLLGKNGDKGLVGQVNDNSKKIATNRTILAAIIGSGILGGGIVGLVQLVT